MIRISTAIQENTELALTVEDVLGAEEKWITSLEEKLRDAAEGKQSRMEFPLPVLCGVTSKNFQVIGLLLRRMQAFLRENPFPETIQILCQDQEADRLVRQVYNFYIAEDKASRMQDPAWD